LNPLKLWLCVLVSLALALGLSCKKKDTPVDATQPLQQSFQAAEPEVRQAIEIANNNLRTGNYQEAGRALAPVVSGRSLTEPQKQAVGLAIKQLNQAIEADPALNTKEMYDLRNKMFKAIDSGHGPAPK